MKRRALRIKLDAAILAHINWIMRFENALLGIDREPFNPEQIGDDAISEFGQWLYANPASFPDSELFERTISLHKLFHQSAAAVAVLIQSFGQTDSIKKRMDELNQISSRLVGSLGEAGNHSRQPSTDTG